MAGDVGKMAVRIVGDNTQFDTAIDKSEKKMSSFGDLASKVGKGLTLFVTTPLLGLAAAAVKSTSSMEDLESSFTVMLGSASKAADLMTKLKVMAAATPFETGDLAGATKTLLAYRINATQVLPVLSMLGDIAQGNSMKLGTMAEVFGRITANGRLQGEELNRLIDVGFDPLAIIADKTGKSMAVLRKEMEKGQITSAMITDAFKTATSQGGQFYKGMEIASKTLSGLISTMNDDLATLGRGFVEDLYPMIKEAVKGVSAFAAKLGELTPASKKLVISIALIGGSIGPVILAVGGLQQAFIAMTTGSGPVMLGIAALAAIIVGIALACENAKNKAIDMQNALAGKSSLANTRAALVEMTNLLVKQEMELEKRVRQARGASDDTITRNMRIELAATNLRQQILLDNIDTINAKADAEATAAKQVEASTTKQIEATKELTSEQQKAADAEAKAANDFEQAARKELQIYEETQNAELTAYLLRLQEIDQANEDFAKKELADAQDLQKKIADEKEKGFQIEKNLREENAKDTKEDQLANVQDAGNAVLALINTIDVSVEKTIANMLELIAQVLVKSGEPIAAAIGIGIMVSTKISEIFSAVDEAAERTAASMDALQSEMYSMQIERNNLLLDAQLAAIDKAEQAALQSAGLIDKTEKQLLEEKLAAAIAEGDAEAQAEIQREMDKQSLLDGFEAQRQAAIEETAKLNRKLAYDKAVLDKEIAVAQAKIDEQSAISALGWGHHTEKDEVRAMYAALISLISSMPLPALASGSSFTGGGSYLTGEQGPEMVRLPPGSQVVNAFDTDRMLANPGATDGGNIHLVVQLDSKPFLDTIFPATKNKTVLISAKAVV